MRTTIDRAGRIVVPKALRERLDLGLGGEVEVEERDGVIEIRPATARVRVVQTPEGPVLEPLEDKPPLSDETVAATREALRR